MADLARLTEVGKWVREAVTGWFSRVVAERGKLRVLRCVLYQEIAYNAAMLNSMTKNGQRSVEDAFLQGVVRGSIRRAYFEQVRGDRATFDALDEWYAIEDVYQGFDWITADVTHYPPGVVHSRIRGAMFRIRRHLDERMLNKRLLLAMAPRLHRTSLEQTLTEPMDEEEVLARMPSG